MKDLGFEKRQVRETVSKNHEWLAKYYTKNLTGNILELIPLDSSIFNKLIEAVGRDVVNTWNMDHKLTPDEGRYSMGNPAEAWKKINKVWSDPKMVAPERIIQDID